MFMTRGKSHRKWIRIHGLIILFLFFVTPNELRSWAGDEGNEFTALREDMVSRQIQDRGITDPEVLKAMRKVLRHLFVPKKHRKYAYGDHPLPIGQGQTISQPYVVAYMTEALQLKPKNRILEIGTGSGYQAAVLAEMECQVYSMEIIESLGKNAEKILNRLGYGNIHIKIGDGYEGWPEKAPFDAVIVTCAPEKIPEPLVRQLKEGGRIIIPVGTSGHIQHLVLAIKKEGHLVSRSVMPVRFVPMVRGPR